MKKYAFFVVLFNRQTKQSREKHTFYFYDYTMREETKTNIYRNSQASPYLLMQWNGMHMPSKIRRYFHASLQTRDRPVL